MERQTAKSKTPFFIGLAVVLGLIGVIAFYSYSTTFDTHDLPISDGKHTINDSSEKQAIKEPSLLDGIFEKETKASISYSLQTSGGTQLISLNKGEKFTFNFPVNNKHPEISTINLKATGDASQFVHFELDSITLQNDGFHNIPVFIEIPSDAESGEYELQLHAKRPDPSGFSLEAVKNIVIVIKS